MADQVAELPPKENGNLRLILIDSYCESYQADQVEDQLADIPPSKTANGNFF